MGQEKRVGSGRINLEPARSASAGGQAALIGPMEWLLLGGIAVLVFGPQLFVKAARGMGHGVAEFKKAVGDGETGDTEDREGNEQDEAGQPSRQGP